MKRLALEKEVRALGCEIVEGTKHKKVYLNGRMVGVLPHGRAKEGGRHCKNLLSDIRRAAAL